MGQRIGWMGDGGWQEFVGHRWHDWDGFGLETRHHNLVRRWATSHANLCMVNMEDITAGSVQ